MKTLSKTIPVLALLGWTASADALVLYNKDGSLYSGPLTFLIRGLDAGTTYPAIDIGPEADGTGPSLAAGVLLSGESQAPGAQVIPDAFLPAGMSLASNIKDDSWGIFKIEAIYGQNSQTGFLSSNPNLNDALWWDSDVAADFAGADQQAFTLNNPLNNSLTGMFYGLVDTYVDADNNGSFTIMSRGGYLDVYERSHVSDSVVFGHNATDRTGFASFPDVTVGDLILSQQFTEVGQTNNGDGDATLDVRFIPNGSAVGSARLLLTDFLNPISGTGSLNDEFGNFSSGKEQSTGGGGYNSIAFETIADITPTSGGTPIGAGNGWTVTFRDDGNNVINNTSPIGSDISGQQVIPEPSTALFGCALTGLLIGRRRRQARQS